MLSNTFEGGTNGTTLTLANSGGASGDALNPVKGATSTLAFSSTQKTSGSLGLSCVSSSGEANYVYWDEPAPAARGVIRFPIYLHTADGSPSATTTYGRINNVGITTMASMQVSTARKLLPADAAGSNINAGLSTTVMALDTLYWCELSATAGTTTSNGTVAWVLYSADGATQLETWTSSAQNAGTTNVGRYRFGRAASSTWAATQLIDDVKADVRASGWLGGSSSTLVATPAVVTFSAPSPVMSGETVVDCGGPAVVTFSALDPTWLGVVIELEISAALVASSAQPQPVRVNITGMTIGQDFQVTASSGSWSRVVQGGEGVAAETQLVLTDIATPLNAPIIYTIMHAGTTVATTVPVTVAYDASDSVFQSLDGSIVVNFWWNPNGDPRTPDVRAAFYRPAGRPRAIMHYDVSGADSGTIVAETAGADTTNLLALIGQGAPVLIRLTPGATVTDIEPVDVLGISAAPRVLRDVSPGPRDWTLAYTLVDDVDTDPLVMVSLADLNNYYAGQMLSAWNAQWAGLMLSDVNAFDWLGS